MARKRTVRPGTPARGSVTGRPVMVLLDLLGRRWSLRILWELRHGPLTFRALQEKCDDASPTVLNRRLAELRAVDLVTHGEGGYAYTRWGRELATQMAMLDAWSSRWAKGIARS